MARFTSKGSEGSWFTEIIRCEDNPEDILEFAGYVGDADTTVFYCGDTNVCPSKESLIRLQNRINEVLGEKEPKELTLQDHAQALIGHKIELTTTGEMEYQNVRGEFTELTFTPSSIKVIEEPPIPAEPAGATHWQMYDDEDTWTYKANDNTFYPNWEEFVRHAHRSGRKVRALAEIPVD